MWERTKRLINSYLDDMIERASSPDRDVRAMTRGEVARLNELEAQARASVKMLEKELAEVELKMMGVAEREKLARESNDATLAASVANDLVTLAAQRDLLQKQIIEAEASANKARRLREERAQLGEELANETYLTSMKETLAGVQSPFGSTDPSSTIDEMRARLARTSMDTTAARVAEADHDLEVERARAKAEELLAQYQARLAGEEPQKTAVSPYPSPASATETASAPASLLDSENEPEQPKTLGPGSGKMRPID